MVQVQAWSWDRRSPRPKFCVGSPALYGLRQSHGAAPRARSSARLTVEVPPPCPEAGRQTAEQPRWPQPGPDGHPPDRAAAEGTPSPRAAPRAGAARTPGRLRRSPPPEPRLGPAPGGAGDGGRRRPPGRGRRLRRARGGRLRGRPSARSAVARERSARRDGCRGAAAGGEGGPGRGGRVAPATPPARRSSAPAGASRAFRKRPPRPASPAAGRSGAASRCEPRAAGREAAAVVAAQVMAGRGGGGARRLLRELPGSARRIAGVGSSLRLARG